MTPVRIRLLATRDDAASVQLIAGLLAQSDQPITCNVSAPANHQPLGIDKVICVWSDKTDRDAMVFREISAWQKATRIPIHLYCVDNARITPFVSQDSASIFYADSNEPLQSWLESKVLGSGRKNSGDSSLLDSLDAVRNLSNGIIEKFQRIDVVGHNDAKIVDDYFISPDLRNEDRVDFDFLSYVKGSNDRHIFIVGVAGSGKSTLLKYWTLQLARDNEQDQLVPIWMQASDVIKSGYNDLETFLKLTVKGLCLSHGRQVVEHIFDHDGLDAEKAILIIDGVDELNGGDRAKLRRLIALFETEYPGVRFVISGRHSGWDPAEWPNYDLIHIVPLPQQDSIAYIQKHASPAIKDALSELVRTTRSIRELASIPFLLALMVSFSGQMETLPTERAKLIGFCVRALLARRAVKPIAYLSEDEIMACLGHVSHRLFRLDFSGKHSEFEYHFAIQEFLAKFPIGRSGDRNLADDADTLLQHFVYNAGLIQFDGGDLTFVHRSIWEYFVALEISNRRAGISEMAYSPVWEEPIRLMVGLISEEAFHGVLEDIWSTNPGLAMRSLSESKFKGTEIVGALIEQSDPTELAELVRDFRTRIGINKYASDLEITSLETVEILIDETKNAEILWESIELLSVLRDNRVDACKLLNKILNIEHIDARLAQLKKTVNFIPLEGGSFVMGSDDPSRSIDERPAHEVELSDFAIADIPLQNIHRGSYPYQLGFDADQRSESPDHPIIGVTWFEAQLAALWFGCRLPTEAEWEFACRARGEDDAILSNVENIPRFAWYAENSDNLTHPPRLREPNSLGLFDMLGNVREWCSDWFAQNYYSACLASIRDPLGPESGVNRVLRGGCFDWNTKNLVPTYRNSNLPNNRGFQNGVRLVLGLPSRLENLMACDVKGA